MALPSLSSILTAVVGLILFIVFISLIQTLIRSGWFFLGAQIRKIIEFLRGYKKESGES